MSKHHSPNPSVNTLDIKTFYGDKYQNTLSSELQISEEDCMKRKDLPRRLNNLLGPTQTWKVFNKQIDALNFAKIKRNGVMTFAFQQWDGCRLFLVAHPQIFWHYDVQKNQSERCSYEIIPEFSTCKLYFDIEFDLELNTGKKGPIVDVFISVVLYFLATLFGIEASKKNIINLDSSTLKKFSRHLIFIFSSHVFANNKSVGAFVNLICQKLKLYLDLVEVPDFNGSCKCCQLSWIGQKKLFCLADLGIAKENLELLVVLDKQGKKVLICDEAVYSRNRHFRLFQNTKWKRNSPLVTCEENLYQPLVNLPKDKLSSEILSEAFFLDSLITHIRFTEKNGKNLNVIHFKSCTLTDSTLYNVKDSLDAKSNTFNSEDTSNHPTQVSPYPEVDEFISSIVYPGHIWRSAYFSLSSAIVYDIVGNRFCRNIGRQHRSNNVKYIVNLTDYSYYQKCHDPDCLTFRSEPVQLPPELKFKLENDFEFTELFNSCEAEISDSELMEVANVLEDLSNDLIK